MNAANRIAEIRVGGGRRAAERLMVRAAQRRAAEERAKREAQLLERSLADLEGPFRHARQRSAAASRATGEVG